MLVAALLLGAGGLRAQGAEPDTARLRRALAAAMDGNFDIVRTELSTDVHERGGTFWLVHARPRRAGYFELLYRHAYHDRVRPETPLYTHVEHTSVIRVGEPGCWRRRDGVDACLDDTIILPFVASDTGHVFQLTWRGPPITLPPPSPVRVQPGADTVPNPALPHLRLTGHRVETRPHRNAGAVSYEYHADFVAAAPGRLNLSVRSLLPGSPLDVSGASETVPVVIVPRGQPVTVLLANEWVRHFHATDRFASTSGNQYLTTVMLLQPGDAISLQYDGFTWRDRFPRPAAEGRDASEPNPPAISRQPFEVDRSRRFNAWIADYLPPDTRMRSAGPAARFF